MKRACNPFRYKSSIETDVRKTFARIRRAQLAARRKEEAVETASRMAAEVNQKASLVKT